MILKIFRSISSDFDSEVLQDDIDRLVECSETWQVFFNITKCKAMTIGNTSEVRNYTIHTNSFKEQFPQLMKKQTWVFDLPLTSNFQGTSTSS